METTFQLLDFLLFAWFGFTAFYLFFYAFLSIFYKYKTQKTITSNAKILVLIPAYQEDKVILKTIQAIIDQDFPKSNFYVMLIADHFDAETINKVEQFPIEVLNVNFPKSTKSIAINYALNLHDKKYDLVAILDADNIVESNFLSELNSNFQNGHRAIQGQRIAKNTNTSFAILDAISEEINNSIFCKGQQVLGFTSRLTGSGMAFEYNLFKTLMSKINAIGGFDKELELLLLQNDASIFYNPNVKIYDEKVSKSKVLLNQRSRWISAQLHYMKKFSKVGIIELVKNGNINLFNKYLQLFLLPKMLMVIILIAGISIHKFILNDQTIAHWLFASLLFVCAYVFVFPKKYLQLKLFKMLYIIPFTILKMTLKLPKLYTANKQFIHTPHES